MTPFEREELKRRAEAKLAAMRERGARLRRRVLTGAVIAFVVIWVAIFAQMVTGNDPALGPIASNVRSSGGETTATEPELRLTSAPDDDEDEASRLEVEREELEATELQAELEAVELEELEAAGTGQS